MSKIAWLPFMGLGFGLWLLSNANLRAKETNDDGMAGTVARLLSPDLRAIEKRLGELNGELEKLPQLLTTPFAERYGYRSATLRDQETPQSVQLDLGRQLKIDRIVAVPAHIPKFGKQGEGYGFPLRFRIEVASNSEMKGAVTVVDRTQKNVENPGRYPLIFQINPIEGRYIRFVSTRHAPVEEPYIRGYMWALEELLVLSGNNVLSARSGPYRYYNPEASEELDFYPHWAVSRITDSQSALGLPVNTQKSPSLGYLSASAEQPGKEKWILLDLGNDYPIDEIRLVPAESEDPEVVGGRGYPSKMVIELSNDPTFQQESWQNTTGGGRLLGFPGGCADTLLPLGYRARYLRILTKNLWRHREGQHAFALAEVQVYSGGKNVALGKTVQVSDATDKPTASGWSPDYLVDGYSSRYRLIEYPEYLELITQRGQLERELVSLLARREKKIQMTGQALTYGGGTLGGLAFLGWGWMLVRQRAVRQRAVTQLRDQIARDLHDDIGCNLGGIVLLSDIGSKSSEDGQAREDFETIRETAEESSQSMKDIVWLIQHGNTGLRDLITRMRQSTDIILRGETASLSVNPAKYKNRKVSLLLRRHVLFAFKEALNNACKHANADLIEVGITISDRELSFEVRDDGRGFDLNENAASGNGLRNLRKRAERLQGTCHIESNPSKGSHIVFTCRLNSDLK
ncbi:MAG: ATP-binding protein [Akkermansiaceae bacterium]